MTKKQKILQLYIIPILIVLISVIFAVIFNDYFFGFITFACGFLNAYYMAIGRWENYIFGIVFSFLCYCLLQKWTLWFCYIYSDCIYPIADCWACWLVKKTIKQFSDCKVVVVEERNFSYIWSVCSQLFAWLFA